MSWSPSDGLSAEHRSALKGLDAVVHLAGEPIAARRWSLDQKRRIKDSRIQSTRTLVDGLAALELTPKVFISASAIGIYGDRGDEELHESSSPGQGFLPEVCVAWEEEAQRAETLGVPVARLRLGLVLGPRGGALQRMLPPFRLGVGGPFGAGTHWMSWIHLDDVIGLFRFILADPSRLSGPVNATAPHPVQNRDFARALGRALRRPAFLPVPSLALRLLFGEMSRVLLDSQRVLPRAAEQAGYRFTYSDLALALEACLDPRPAETSATLL